MRRSSLSFLATMPFLTASAFAFDVPLKPLLEGHCIDCHGPDAQKGGLRLDQDVSMGTWIKVHDKLVSGEMPPKKKERPPKDLLDASIRTLHDSLRTASLEKQRTQGRVPFRRLNGTEYENTVRELVGTNVKLKEILPQDNSAGGFDNVGAVLDVSSTHLLLYQEAAEKAVFSAIPKHPPLSVKERRSGREMTKFGGNFQQALTRSCFLKGDALVVYSKLPRYGLVCTPNVQGAGHYKIRMSASAVGTAGVPVPVAFCTVDRGREPPVVRDMVDFQPGAPRLIETEVELEAGEAFVVNLMLNWDIRSTKKPIEDYTGPGFLIEWLEIEGPVGEYPSKAYRTLFGDAELMPKSVVKAKAEGRKPQDWSKRTNIYQWQNDPLQPVSASPKEEAAKLIRAFLPRAFRRPVTEEMQQHFVSLVHAKLDAGDSYLDAMTFGYKSILTSPHFLFFIEKPGEQGLDRFALASRLSYFLTSLPPDDELLAADLTKSDELRKQTERLLNSPRASGFTDNFTGQWLELRKIDATIPDPNLYGDFDGTLLWSMPEETRRFFDDVLKHDRSVLEFVDGQWSIINRRLAEHYGIVPAFDAATHDSKTPSLLSSAPPSEFRRVSLPADSHRGGVMTHGSVLKVTADGTTTSPVLRGKWVLEHIIGKPPPPPPPSVPAIQPDIRGATTIREQLAKHRSIESCNACHQYIDPPGFALESFDPIGGYRDFYRASAKTKAGTVQLAGYSGRPVYRGPDVEKGGVTHDGKTFTSIADYKRILLDEPDQIARNLAQKLLTYATGAEPQFADREIIEQIVANVKSKNYGFRTLIHEIVQSRPFRNK